MPYTSRLYADGLLTMHDSIGPRRLASAMLLLGSSELASEVVDRQLSQQSEVGAVHYSRAYLDALQGADAEVVLLRLRTASSLGYDLTRHAGERVFHRYLDDPELRALFEAPEKDE